MNVYIDPRLTKVRMVVVAERNNSPILSSARSGEEEAF